MLMNCPNSTTCLLVVTLLLGVVSSGLTQSKKKVDETVRKVASIDPETLRGRFTPDPEWILRDKDGREVEAKLISAHGEVVKIQRTDDEKEFEVPIAMFDAYTEERIRAWIDRDPEAVDFSLELSASRELVDSNDFEISNRNLKTTKWSYRVKLTNLTRNPLSGAEVEYRIIYDDNVDFIRTSAMPGEGKAQQEGQSVDIPTIQFNDEIEFLTPPIETHTYEYKTSRDRDFAKDDIKGVWVRVVRHDEVIAEFKSNEAAMSGYSWDNESEVEIRITNRFREAFEPSEEE